MRPRRRDSFFFECWQADLAGFMAACLATAIFARVAHALAHNFGFYLFSVAVVFVVVYFYVRIKVFDLLDV